MKCASKESRYSPGPMGPCAYSPRFLVDQFSEVRRYKPTTPVRIMPRRTGGRPAWEANRHPFAIIGTNDCYGPLRPGRA